MAFERRWTCDRCGHQKVVDSRYEREDQPPPGWVIIKVGVIPIPGRQVVDCKLLCFWCACDLKEFVEQPPEILAETPDGATKCRCGCRDSNARVHPPAAKGLDVNVGDRHP